MGFRWPCLKQELQQHQPPVNGVSAIFTGSRECTTLNPILESQHSGEPGLAVGIAGSSSRECSASELGGRHGRASVPNILRLPSESALTSTTEREKGDCYLSLHVNNWAAGELLQQQCCLLEIGKLYVFALLLRFYNKLLVFHFKC